MSEHHELNPSADPGAAAREIALRQLAMAPRTRAQLAAALARKGVPEDLAGSVLDRLTEVRLVDDEEFAGQWVRSRQLGRGLARRALAYELRHRGVAEQTVRDALQEIDDTSELEAARQLVRKRWPALASDPPDRRDRRLAGMLARKGYGPGTAHRAIREVAEQFGADDRPGLESPDRAVPWEGDDDDPFRPGES